MNCVLLVKNSVYLVVVILLFGCHHAIGSDVSSLESVSIREFSYKVELSQPFGEVLVSLSSTDGILADSLSVSYNGNRYELNEEIWGDVFVLDMPSISFREFRDSAGAHLKEFQVWFSFGDMETHEIAADPIGCKKPCYVHERPILGLVFDIDGLLRVARYKFGDSEPSLYFDRTSH